MMSPASTSTMSPGFKLVAGDLLGSPSVRAGSSLAMVSVLVLRRLAACALPRPSAMASAKLANSTVNQSQRLIWNEKPRSARPATRSRRKRSGGQGRDDLDHEHDRVANQQPRVELLKAAPSAGTTIEASRNDRLVSRRRIAPGGAA